MIWRDCKKKLTREEKHREHYRRARKARKFKGCSVDTEFQLLDGAADKAEVEKANRYRLYLI